MASTALSAVLGTRFSVTEDTGDAPTGIHAPSLFEAFNARAVLSAGGAGDVLCSLLSVYKTTISGGGYTVDLTNAQGTNGAVDGTGLHVIGLCVDNSYSDNEVSIEDGASDEYSLNDGDPLVVPAGGFLLLYFGAELGAISSGAKNVQILGTNDDAPSVAFLIGGAP